MLRRARASVRRMPGVARPIAIAALLLVAAAANLAARSESPIRWLSLLVVAVSGAVVAGSPSRLWPLPAIWVVATLIVPTTGAAVDAATVVTSLVVGGVALVAAVAADVLSARHQRLRRVPE